MTQRVYLQQVAVNGRILSVGDRVVCNEEQETFSNQSGKVVEIIQCSEPGALWYVANIWFDAGKFAAIYVEDLKRPAELPPDVWPPNPGRPLDIAPYVENAILEEEHEITTE